MLEPETIDDFIGALEPTVKPYANNAVVRNHLINADEVGINTSDTDGWRMKYFDAVASSELSLETLSMCQW